jgi:cell volume regulation protein A
VTFTFENILLLGAILIVLSVVFTKTTARFGVPALLLFLMLGMIAGADGPGRIHFDNPKLAQFIGSFCLSFILFSGGLDTRISDVKKVFLPGLLLSTVGVLLTCLAVGVFVSMVTPFTLLEGLLLGAIVSSTDAAAVFSILRSKGLKLKGKIRPLLEFESGSNDPMAYFLTIVFLFLISNPEKSYWLLIPLFIKQMVIGGLIGYLAGRGMQIMINWVKLEAEGLYSVLLIGMTLLTFSGTHFLGGNAYLAVYLAALTLSNYDFVHKRSLSKHFDGLAWLMQIILFLTLGLQVFPSQIVPYFGIGLLIALFLIVIARPLTVFIVLLPFRMNIRSRLFISWVGLRGAVPIVFAMIPLTLGIANANAIFNIVFFITVTSVIIQGTSVPLAAKILRLGYPELPKNKVMFDRDMTEKMRSLMDEIVIGEDFGCKGKAIVELNLPSSVLIVLVKRDAKTLFIPDGSTILQPGDKIMVIADNRESISTFNNCLRNLPTRIQKQ